MKRWKTTLDGKPIILYGNTADEIKKIADDGATFTEYVDDTYKQYIELIKEGIFVGLDYRGRETYDHPCPLGSIRIKLSKADDDEYYDFAMYQIWADKRRLDPCSWTLSDPQTAYGIANQPQMKYLVYSHRRWGEPKLDKPKELNGG